MMLLKKNKALAISMGIFLGLTGTSFAQSTSDADKVSSENKVSVTDNENINANVDILVMFLKVIGLMKHLII